MNIQKLADSAVLNLIRQAGGAPCDNPPEHLTPESHAAMCAKCPGKYCEAGAAAISKMAQAAGKAAGN